MSKLHITVSNKKALYRERDGEIVCGNSDYEIEFAFDEEWDSHVVKTVRFIWNGQYQDVVLVEDTCAVPVLNETDSVTVGVYAGNLCTTTPAVITCKRSILCGGGLPENEPPESVYTQLLEKIDEVAATETRVGDLQDEIDALEDEIDALEDEISEIEETGECYLKKVSPSDGLSRLYGIRARSDTNESSTNGSGQEEVIVQGSVNGTETYRTIPRREAVNSNTSTHPGTFDVWYPKLPGSTRETTQNEETMIDEIQSQSYPSNGSPMHPVPIGMAEYLYAKKAELKVLEEKIETGEMGDGYVTTEEFEAFKDELTYKPISITLFTVNGTNTFEKGTTVTSVELQWNTNTTPATQKIDGVAVSGYRKTVTGHWSSYNSWELEVTDNKGASDSASTMIFFYNRIYYGASSASSATNEIIAGFGGTLRGTKVSSFSVDCDAGEYIYYCLPTSFGTCGFIDESTGLGYAFEAPETVSFTNSLGHTENYYVYRSTYAIEGKANIKVT